MSESLSGTFLMVLRHLCIEPHPQWFSIVAALMFVNEKSALAERGSFFCSNLKGTRNNEGAYMTNQKPFRFGLATGKVSSHSAWRDKAHKVEDLGYDILLMPNHMTTERAQIAALAVA